MTATPAIRVFTLGDFQTNCHLVTVPGTRACIVVDVGQEPDAMLDAIEEARLEVHAILLTHCHMDHIAGLDEARSRLGDVPVYVHERERGFCSDPMHNLSVLSGMPVVVAEPDRFLQGGETLDLAGASWRVLHTPGHSPGGVTFVNDASRQAIVGDTLFAGSIGRVDFPTASPADMRRTLSNTLMALPDDYTVYPGHGPTTTIGHERRTNPYLRGGW